MSVAVHMNGRKRGQMNAPLAAHQVRLNEEDAKKALKDTESAINPKLSHMNVALVPDQSKNKFKDMKKKLDKISDKRVERGGKKLYKSANVFMVGTLQIGDDSLEKLGWKWGEDGKKLPSDKQSEGTINNVKMVYADMMKSVQAQPEIYGEVFSGTLHMDEGSPHVDFMTDVLDVNEPDKLVAHYLNGPKGTGKGNRLRNMQDKLMKHTRFKGDTLDKFDLKRGDSQKDKVDKVKNIRVEEKNLDRDRTSLEALRGTLKEWDGEIQGREGLVEQREAMANIKDDALKVKNDLVEAKISRLEAMQDVEGRFSDTLDKYAENPSKMNDIRAIIKKNASNKPMNNEQIISMSEDLDEMNDDGKKTLNEQVKAKLKERGLEINDDDMKNLDKLKDKNIQQ